MTATSEQLAWQLYGDLQEPDRHLVDAWRALGNDWLTSVLNSGVLRRGGRRVHPNDAATDEWLSRRLNPAPARQKAAEHEAAHAIVAAALGVRVVDITITEDGSGETIFETASSEDSAVIATAGGVWVGEIRWREFPEGDGGCHGDRLALMRCTDDFGARLAADKARRILRERGDDVLRLAAWLERVDSQPPPLREELVQAEIRRISGGRS